MMMRMDPTDGSAEIQGHQPVPGRRVVLETRNEDGDMIYVVRTPGYHYSSQYVPASFAVFALDYGEQDRRFGIPEEDAPWFCVRLLVSFPTALGTRGVV